MKPDLMILKREGTDATRHAGCSIKVQKLKIINGLNIMYPGWALMKGKWFGHE